MPMENWRAVGLNWLSATAFEKPIRCGTVSGRVNYVGNDDAECSLPVEIAQT
jgi:hypothetical protein